MSAQRRTELALQAGLFVVAALLAASTIRRGISPHDEGLMLQWGIRLADGQWPYRDFWSNYPPGQTVVIAALTKVFGPSLMAWRVVRVLVGAAASIVAYRLVLGESRGGSRWPALGAWAAVAGAMAWPLSPGPNAAATLLALSALLAARRRVPVAAGILAGLCAFFRLEVGAAAIVGVLLIAPGGRAQARAAVAAAATLLLAMLPFLIAGGGDFVDQLIGYAKVAGRQRLPFPLHPSGIGLDPNKQLEYWFPAILVAGSALWLAWALARRPERRGWALLPLLVVGLAYLLSRTDEFHLIPLSVALAVAAAVAVARERGAWRVVMLVVLALVAVYGWERQAGIILHPTPLAAVPGAAADGVRTEPGQAAALRRVLARVHELAPPGSPVLVAPPRYDRVRVGAPLLNVLLDRPNPSRYDVIQSGIVTTAKVQREIAGDLARTRTPVVVRWLGEPARHLEDNASARSSGVTILDRAIARDYRPAGRYGDWAVYARRPDAP